MTTRNIPVLKLPILFDNFVKKLYGPIELLCLKRNLGLAELTASTNISKVKLLETLGVPSDAIIGDIVFRIIRRLSCFLSSDYSNSLDEDLLSVLGILKAFAILNPDKASKLIPDSRLRVEILILSFSDDNIDIFQDLKTDDFNSTTRKIIGVPMIGQSIFWSQIVELRDSITQHIKRTNISATSLLSIVQLCLLLSTITLGQNHMLQLSKLRNINGDKSWCSYHNAALCLLRSCDLSLSENNYIEKNILAGNFADLICNPTKPATVTFPRLLDSISCMMDSMFYDQLNNIEPNGEIQLSSNILSAPVLAQLATVFSADLVYTGLQKMYIASNDGFSISALENRIFKWTAPTIMFLKGRAVHKSKISHDHHHYHAAHPPSMKSTFERDFPKFYPKEDCSLPNNDDFEPGHEVLFAIYIEEPWKISNNECFGNSSSFILQMLPRQIICRASNLKDNFAYFSNVGGGVGFGSQPPLTRSSVTVYRPGEISLTVDSGLEYGNFRHLSVPGTFGSGSCYLLNGKVPEYEIFFHITSLEVWGCGSKKELEEQKKRWDWENREAASRKQLNSASWDDGRALLEMAGLVGKNQYGGSI